MYNIKDKDNVDYEYVAKYQVNKVHRKQGTKETRYHGNKVPKKTTCGWKLLV